MIPLSKSYRKERALLMHALYMGGETLEQIGERFGLTRERVRQILEKNGRSLGVYTRVDLTLLGRIRHRLESGEARSLTEALKVEGANSTMLTTLARLGLAEEWVAIAARNRCYQIVMSLLEHYRALAEQLGRAPTAHELGSTMCPYQYWFGSLSRIALLAGYQPRGRYQQLDPDHMRNLHRWKKPKKARGAER